ncbi:unnamed protein product [Hymenolepis diminuta]|uniref:Uncharacterized protein n=1 Tax=Hymenolepis diminuta TaxID=6216 RepID=A0A564YYN3_HYMDI|nr:unnamed protein product [Hymenolepis diminuta]
MQSAACLQLMSATATKAYQGVPEEPDRVRRTPPKNAFFSHRESEQSVGEYQLSLVVQTERTRKYRPSIDREDPFLIRQLSNEYQKQSFPRFRFCKGSRYHREWFIEDVAARITTKIVAKKASAERPLRAVQ